MSTRRRFIQRAVVGVIGMGAGYPLLRGSFARARPLSSRSLLPADPILDIADPAGADSRDFTGDDFKRPHLALRNKIAYIASKGGIPAPTESANVVIAGGGIAGLTAAFRLQDKNPLLLEQAQQ